jgi:mRNA interferase YafQ
MRTIETTKQFKKDFKRELKGVHKACLQTVFPKIVTSLANDESLLPKYKDHPLTGNWSDHRDCHIKPDLVLIYRKPDRKKLQLVRLGSHSELSF